MLRRPIPPVISAPLSPLPPAPNPNPNDFDNLLESQLEDLLLKKLDPTFNNAISHLVSLGFDEVTALSAVLSNGQFYGSGDPFFDVVRNASVHFTFSFRLRPAFPDLRRLQLHDLYRVVSLLRLCRPKLNRRLALWCLLVAGFRLGQACLVPIAGGGNDDRLLSLKNHTISDVLASMPLNLDRTIKNRRS